ncbi:MAG TPA: hypothetical protein DCY74_00050 [Clostridiales bacterium]|nr:hypothetical protein [Clostridiales bacterium]
MTFPTHDFEAYYKSGLDEHGFFIYEKADRSLLINTRYPEWGEQWGVDDGHGYIDDEGKTYNFVGYFTLANWRNIVWDRLKAISKAYLLTGDQKYADVGILLLDRIADVYPGMNHLYQLDRKDYVTSNGGSTGEGKIAGRIEDCYFALCFPQYYDAFFHGFATLSPEAIQNIARYSHGKRTMPEQIMVHIENNILKEIYQSIRERNVGGNMGMQQSALTAAAICIDHPDFTPRWLEYVFQDGDGFKTGGNLDRLLCDTIDRDGMGNEAAPAYNAEWTQKFATIADLLQGYTLEGKDTGYSLYNHPKFRKMFLGETELRITRNILPTIGDTGSTGRPYPQTSAIQNLWKAYQVYKEPKFAAALMYLLHHNPDELEYDIFTSDPETCRNQLLADAKAYGAYHPHPVNLTGYGYASLKRHHPNLPDSAALVFYGRNAGHGHLDNLNLMLYAYNMDFSPDMGNPEIKNATNPHRYQMCQNTISHNTVIVNEGYQNQTVIVGDCLHHDDSDFVKLTDVESKPYQDVACYRRTVANVKVDENAFYVVDFFRVKGKDDHMYGFHGAQSDGIQSNGLSFVDQLDETGAFAGTLAGKDISLGTLIYQGESVYHFRGFQWFDHVRRDARPAPGAWVNFSLVDTHRCAQGLQGKPGLKYFMAGDLGEVISCNGYPPRNVPSNPKYMPYVFIKRKGSNLTSTFVSVFSPYDSAIGCPVASVVPVAVTPHQPDKIRAVKVTLTSGRTDYIVNAIDVDTVYRVDNAFDFCGFFGVYSQNGNTRTHYIHDGTQIGENKVKKDIRGSIVSFTNTLSTKNVVELELDPNNPIPAAGQFLVATGPTDTNPMYRILGVSQQGKRVTLDMGDVTFIQNKTKEGYRYTLQEGTVACIPLTHIV